MDEHSLGLFDLSAPRYPGWAIKLIMHSQSSHSAVVTFVFVLAGTDGYPERDSGPARVLLPQTPLGDRAISHLLGTCGDPRTRLDFEPGKLRVGHHLVWMHEASMTEGVCLLPIAHLVAWYKP